ncbi:hypothetical protein PT2222_160097 [Paraburkholderia tropica]
MSEETGARIGEDHGRIVRAGAFSQREAATGPAGGQGEGGSGAGRAGRAVGHGADWHGLHAIDGARARRRGVRADRRRQEHTRGDLAADERAGRRALHEVRCADRLRSGEARGRHGAHHRRYRQLRPRQPDVQRFGARSRVVRREGVSAGHFCVHVDHLDRAEPVQRERQPDHQGPHAARDGARRAHAAGRHADVRRHLADPPSGVRHRHGPVEGHVDRRGRSADQVSYRRRAPVGGNARGGAFLFHDVADSGDALEQERLAQRKVRREVCSEARH